MSNKPRRLLLAEQFRFAVVLVVSFCALFFSDALWRIDNVIYDAHMKYWSKKAPDDIIIIEIDEQSLRQFGRWPWPRYLHAELINKLTQTKAKGIVLDLIFAEANRNDPISDSMLVEAIKNNGKVIMPVLVEKNRLSGQLIETLPIPQLSNVARELGHVHVELDQDGIARSTYLKEGLGNPYWDNIALPLYRLAYDSGIAHIPGARNQNIKKENPNIWVRDYHVYIPYIGPPGHLNRVSFSDVLSPNYPLDFLDNKIIFIGVTATGLGDVLPTPVSGQRHAMPGVEINATIFHALRNNHFIEKADEWITLIIGLLFVVIPVFIYPRLPPFSALLATIVLVITASLTTIVALRFQYLWMPPMATIIVLLSSFPLWSWRRLDYTIKSLNEELELLNTEKAALKYQVTHSLRAEFDFLSKMIPILGLEIYFSGTRHKVKFGSVEKKLFQTEVTNSAWNCYISWSSEMNLNTNQKQLVDQFIFNAIANSAVEGKGTVEIIQKRVEDVKDATNQIRSMRQVIDESIEQMRDGVLITNQFGTLININNEARKILNISEKDGGIGNPLFTLLEQSDIEINDALKGRIYQSIESRAAFSIQSITNSGLSVMIKSSPITDSAKNLSGLIINITDITQLKEHERQREELINFLSHDLRAPLTSTNSELDLAESRIQNTEQQLFVERLKILNARALSLAEGFVQFTRAENISELSLEEINVVSICDNAIDQQWAQSHEKNISICPIYSSPSIEILGDFDLVERTFVNLISNAIKYSPENTEIIIEIFESPSKVICSFKDQGYGIEEEHIGKLFDRFQRMPSTKNLSSGVGLGLTFVKTVVEKHHGDIRVVSELGKGSEFILEFERLHT